MLCGGGNLAKERDFCQDNWRLGILIHPPLVARIEGQNVSCELCSVESARERAMTLSGGCVFPKVKEI